MTGCSLKQILTVVENIMKLGSKKTGIFYSKGWLKIMK